MPMFEPDESYSDDICPDCGTRRCKGCGQFLNGAELPHDMPFYRPNPYGLPQHPAAPPGPSGWPSWLIVIDAGALVPFDDGEDYPWGNMN